MKDKIVQGLNCVLIISIIRLFKYGMLVHCDLVTNLYLLLFVIVIW